MDYRQLDGTSTTAATDNPMTDQKQAPGPIHPEKIWVYPCDIASMHWTGLIETDVPSRPWEQQDYVRADLHDAAIKQRDELAADLEAMTKIAQRGVSPTDTPSVAENEMGLMQSYIAEMEVKNQDLDAIITLMRKALEFYADDKNWLRSSDLDPNSGNFTGGPAKDVLSHIRAIAARGGE